VRPEGYGQLTYHIQQANPINRPIDPDTSSLVAESYLSDHHIHHQQTDANLTPFQQDFLHFCTSIAKFGSVRELGQIAIGKWTFPEVVAQMAVDNAGTFGYDQYYQFLTDYRNLSRHPGNDIERIADLNLKHLAWTGTEDPSPAQLGAMDGSLFLSRIARQVLFIVRLFKFQFLIK
jgi:hypothetical protein